MKYNTISTSSLSSEGRKSTLTLYTDSDFINEKVPPESEISSIRGELEIVQRALKMQTRRCRQLVAEYTRRLQEKEQQYQSEKLLRDDQLAKVLRALLIFEARLKQEQKFISHQLKEKDYIIKKQRDDIDKLSNQFCKHCNQYYSPIHNLESLDSSSEYVATDYQDYQSSNFESLDSSSETYATISEKDYINKKTPISELEEKSDGDRKIFLKNKPKDSFSKRGRKIGHRKSVGTYFEVLKLRNDNPSPSSNDDNTSNDYENLESLPPESVSDKISLVSERIETIFAKCTNTHLTEDNLGKHDNQFNDSANEENNPENEKLDKDIETRVCDNNDNIVNTSSVNNIDVQNNINETIENSNISKITESIPVFEADGETNDNWYASASDQEDDEQRDIYRNNPVLECMNQILLQNINDNINSPPKTPTVDRRQLKNNKRVKFSDEENIVLKENLLNSETAENGSNIHSNYYEIPIQKMPNFYETPQSIYSNDYEQILTKCGDSLKPNLITHSPKKLSSPKSIIQPAKTDSETEGKENHYYVDMDTKSEIESEPNIIRKSKIIRTPPALPPKPANLLSKYKLHNQNKPVKSNTPSIDSDPDYCSISELNLPTHKMASAKKLNVVAEINIPNSQDASKISEKHIILHSPKQKDVAIYDLNPVHEKVSLIIPKSVEKANIQVAKHTPIKSETSLVKVKPKNEPEIPKLPQVSEIIIPEENESNKEEHISHDNYIKNNSQILKTTKSNRSDNPRRSILIGSSVSSLITSFNNQQLLSEIQNKSPKFKTNKKAFPSFEGLQNPDKRSSLKPVKSPEPQNFEKFDLSQNFEEFKLDDCEIEEYTADINTTDPILENSKSEEHVLPDILSSPTNSTGSSTHVEIVRATNDIAIPQLNNATIQQLKKKLELDKNRDIYQEITAKVSGNEPSYEHFLECTGLSSKSILTPSRLLSNHKSMLKPKDVKLRSKVKSSVLDKQGSTIKYWSEPYI